MPTIIEAGGQQIRDAASEGVSELTQIVDHLGRQLSGTVGGLMGVFGKLFKPANDNQQAPLEAGNSNNPQLAELVTSIKQLAATERLAISKLVTKQLGNLPADQQLTIMQAAIVLRAKGVELTNEQLVSQLDQQLATVMITPGDSSVDHLLKPVSATAISSGLAYCATNPTCLISSLTLLQLVASQINNNELSDYATQLESQVKGYLKRQDQQREQQEQQEANKLAVEEKANKANILITPINPDANKLKILITPELREDQKTKNEGFESAKPLEPLPGFSQAPDWLTKGDIEGFDIYQQFGSVLSFIEAEWFGDESWARINQVIEETINSEVKGNGFTSKIELTETEALELALEWLGEGHKEIGRPGQGVYVNKAGDRMFRMDDGSLLGTHPPKKPHVHIEKIDLKTGDHYARNHIILNQNKK